MKLALALQIAGLAAISVGSFLISVVAGLLVAGTALVALGLAVERG